MAYVGVGGPLMFCFSSLCAGLGLHGIIHVRLTNCITHICLLVFKHLTELLVASTHLN